MSESEATVLGKRERGAKEAEDANGQSTVVDAEQEESDDDIGPMPMPADTLEAKTARKKRKGANNDSHNSILPS